MVRKFSVKTLTKTNPHKPVNKEKGKKTVIVYKNIVFLVCCSFKTVMKMQRKGVGWDAVGCGVRGL